MRKDKSVSGTTARASRTRRPAENTNTVQRTGDGRTRSRKKAGGPPSVPGRSRIIVSDTPGILAREGRLYEENGFLVAAVNTAQSGGIQYNPFRLFVSERDIARFADELIVLSQADPDRRFPESSMLLAAVMLYLYSCNRALHTMQNVGRLLRTAETRDSSESELDLLFEFLARREPEHPAVRMYRNWKLSEPHALQRSLSVCMRAVSGFENRGAQEDAGFPPDIVARAEEEAGLPDLLHRRSAVYVIVSPCDSVSVMKASLFLNHVAFLTSTERSCRSGYETDELNCVCLPPDAFRPGRFQKIQDADEDLFFVTDGASAIAAWGSGPYCDRCMREIRSFRSAKVRNEPLRYPLFAAPDVFVSGSVSALFDAPVYEPGPQAENAVPYSFDQVKYETLLDLSSVSRFYEHPAYPVRKTLSPAGGTDSGDRTEDTAPDDGPGGLFPAFLYGDGTKHGKDNSVFFIKGDEFVIGSAQESDCVPVDTHGVGARHCRILKKEDGFFAEDLGSGTGTFVDGERLEPGQLKMLSHGTEIIVSTNTFMFFRMAEGTAAGSEDAEAPCAGTPRPDAAWSPFDILFVEDGVGKAGKSPDEKDIPIPDGDDPDAEDLLSLKDADFGVDEEVPAFLERPRFDGPDMIRISKSGFIIGRSGPRTDYCIEDSLLVSRLHCCVLRKGNTFFIEDLGSVNGTYVDGMRVEPGTRVQIEDGQEIKVADVTFMFRIPRRPDSSGSPTQSPSGGADTVPGKPDRPARKTGNRFGQTVIAGEKAARDGADMKPSGRDGPERQHGRDTGTRVPPSLRASLTPGVLYDMLSKDVYGQEDAKRKVSMLVYNFLRGRTSNLLVAGPTGSGKSALIDSLRQIRGLDVRVLDGSRLGPDGYTASTHLQDAFPNDSSRRFILVVDEFDKMCEPHFSSKGTDYAKLNLNQFLLLLDHKPIQFSGNYGNGVYSFNTDGVSVILLGAWERMAQNIAGGSSGIGFGAAVKDVSVPDTPDFTPEDYVRFGVRREIVGRINSFAYLNLLTVSDFRRILDTPVMSPVERISEEYGIMVTISDALKDSLAEKAYGMKLGCRSIYSELKRRLDMLIFSDCTRREFFLDVEVPDAERTDACAGHSDACGDVP